MFDGYLVKGLKAVYDLERFAVFLDDTEPLGSVR